MEESPIEDGSLSHYLQVFFTFQVVCLGILNHQQYVKGEDEQLEIGQAWPNILSWGAFCFPPEKKKTIGLEMCVKLNTR